MATGREGNVVEQLEYKNCEIKVVEKEVSHELHIDNQPIEAMHDADTGAYMSPEAPYSEYGSLVELGKAIVDVREERR